VLLVHARSLNSVRRIVDRSSRRDVDLDLVADGNVDLSYLQTSHREQLRLQPSPGDDGSS